jgi:hypothetical protein
MVTRDEWLDLVVGYVDCGDHDDPVRFRALVAPGEPPSVAASMAKMSTCGLFVRGLLAQLGAADARLVAPYRVGQVNSDIAAMAHEANAIRLLDEAEPGDIVMILGPEHVFVVESIDGDVWSTIQGGERDQYRDQVIERIERHKRGGAFDGRPFYLCIDFDALASKFLP